MLEFGFSLLLSTMKESDLSSCESAQHLANLLVPFIEMIRQGLQVEQVRTLASALRCYEEFLRFESLPPLQEFVQSSIPTLFLTLRRHSSSAAQGGESAELSMVLFKVITAILKSSLAVNLSDSDLVVLLHYVEQNLTSAGRQTTAFILLKALLHRRLKCAELSEVIDRVRHLAVQANQDHVRLQARQAYLAYLLDYPLGPKLRRHLEFLLAQLQYDEESGRSSALEMIHGVVTRLEEKSLEDVSDVFFVCLAHRLCNESTANCRKMIVVCLKSLLRSMQPAKLDELMKIAASWLESGEPAHQRLGAQVIGMFAEANESYLRQHFGDLVRALTGKIDDSIRDFDENSANIAANDHLSYQLLICGEKLLSAMPAAVRDAKFAPILNPFWDVVRRALLYPHLWVRLAAAQLIGFLFAAYRPEEFAGAAGAGAVGAGVAGAGIRSNEYLMEFGTGRGRIAEICDDCCAQLRSHELTKEICDQIIKNLVFLGKVMAHLPDQPSSSNEESRSATPDGENVERARNFSLRRRFLPKSFDVETLAKQLGQLCKYEINHQPNSTIKRESVFKWVGAMAYADGDGPSGHLPKIVSVLLPYLHRELALQCPEENLQNLATEVIAILKQKIGDDELNKAVVECMKIVALKKTKRKQDRAIQAINEPEKAASRKIRRHKAKIESKKRRILTEKPWKRKKLTDDSN